MAQIEKCYEVKLRHLSLTKLETKPIQGRPGKTVLPTSKGLVSVGVLRTGVWVEAVCQALVCKHA